MTLPSAPSEPPLLQRHDIKNLAIFRALRLGDMLCAVPALRAIRASLPHAHITLIGLPWAEQFARRFRAYIDEFIAFPGHPAFPEQPFRKDELPAFRQTMQSRRFDLALQMHGSGEISNRIVAGFGARMTAGFFPAGGGAAPSGNHLAFPQSGPEPLRLLDLARFLGASADGDHLEFPLGQQDADELKNAGLPADIVAGNYICLHPGASTLKKCWPLQRFAEIGDRLYEEFRRPIVLTGSEQEFELAAGVAERMKAKAINAAAPVSIGAMAALMNEARLLVCNDTGVSHIAAGLKLPSVVVFSTADIGRWAPLNRHLHRCVWDPEGRKAADVLQQARSLLGKPD
jgi:ADP-heptose:LPS heptosyltransferase